MDGGNPGAKDGTAGEDDRAKDRTSGCGRRDFSRSCRLFAYAGLKRHKEMLIYILIYLF